MPRRAFFPFLPFFSTAPAGVFLPDFYIFLRKSGEKSGGKRINAPCNECAWSVSDARRTAFSDRIFGLNPRFAGGTMMNAQKRLLAGGTGEKSAAFAGTLHCGFFKLCHGRFPPFGIPPYGRVPIFDNFIIAFYRKKSRGFPENNFMNFYVASGRLSKRYSAQSAQEPPGKSAGICRKNRAASSRFNKSSSAGSLF